jgi:hypothetical protein
VRIERRSVLLDFAANVLVVGQESAELLPRFSHFGIALELISKWDVGCLSRRGSQLGFFAKIAFSECTHSDT